jgi:hypothetical protein
MSLLKLEKMLSMKPPRPQSAARVQMLPEGQRKWPQGLSVQLSQLMGRVKAPEWARKVLQLRGDCGAHLDTQQRARQLRHSRRLQHDRKVDLQLM